MVELSWDGWQHGNRGEVRYACMETPVDFEQQVVGPGTSTAGQWRPAPRCRARATLRIGVAVPSGATSLSSRSRAATVTRGTRGRGPACRGDGSRHGDRHWHLCSRVPER
jgi:hypothetical protein